MFELYNICKYRTELMGLAAIMIILCHAVGRGVAMPFFIASLFSLGNYGVDVFLFLSGLGLYSSLRKTLIVNNDIDGSGLMTYTLSWTGCKLFYLKRLQKILIPYLIIMVPYYVFWSIVKGCGIKVFFLNVSTIGFWLFHEGAWYVALLIPLYLIAPPLFILFESLRKVKWPVLGNAIVVFMCFALCIVHQNDNNPEILNNICFTSRRIPSFFMGMWLAPKILKKEKTHWAVLILLFLIGIGLTKFFNLYYHHNSFCPAWLLVLPITSICCLFLRLKVPMINRIAAFLGNLSLESYLTNITLPAVFLWLFARFGFEKYNIGNYLLYSLTIVVGVSLSLAVHRISTKINLRK